MSSCPFLLGWLLSLLSNAGQGWSIFVFVFVCAGQQKNCLVRLVILGYPVGMLNTLSFSMSQTHLISGSKPHQLSASLQQKMYPLRTGGTNHSTSMSTHLSTQLWETLHQVSDTPGHMWGQLLGQPTNMLEGVCKIFLILCKFLTSIRRLLFILSDTNPAPEQLVTIVTLNCFEHFLQTIF